MHMGEEGVMECDSGTHGALGEVATRPPQGGVTARVLLGTGTHGHLTSHRDQTG